MTLFSGATCQRERALLFIWILLLSACIKREGGRCEKKWNGLDTQVAGCYFSFPPREEKRGSRARVEGLGACVACLWSAAARGSFLFPH